MGGIGKHLLVSSLSEKVALPDVVGGYSKVRCMDVCPRKQGRAMERDQKRNGLNRRWVDSKARAVTHAPFSKPHPPILPGLLGPMFSTSCCGMGAVWISC